MTATDPKCTCPPYPDPVERCPLCESAGENAKRLALAERVIESYEKLCAAYRLGRRPSSVTLDTIAEWKYQAEGKS
jgi:nicotinic acid mononucleotide adenylyltransferase